MRRFLVIAIAMILGGLSSTCGVNEDQLLIVETTLRRLDGQFPFRDFELPHGPIAARMLLFFYSIASTGGWALVFASSVLNALMAFLSFEVVYRVSRDRSWALRSGILSAVWFLPIFGNFYNDHLAYLFAAAAGAIYLLSSHPFSAIPAGAFLCLSFLTKQTVGLGALASLMVLMAFSKMRSRLRVLGVMGGFAMSMGVFVAVLALNGALADYWQQNWVRPIEFASREGTDKSIFHFVTTLLLPYHIRPWEIFSKAQLGKLAFYPLVLCLYFGYWAWIQFSNIRPHITYFLLSTLWSSAVLGRGFSQLFFGTGIVLGLGAFQCTGRARWFSRIVALCVLVSGFLHLTWIRDPFSRTLAPQTTDLVPIRVEKTLSKCVAHFLEIISDKPTAMLGDKGLLVSAARRTPMTNPNIYFDDGLTIPSKKDERITWQRRYIDIVDRRGTVYILVDAPKGEYTFRRRTDGLDSLPLIKEWLMRRFVSTSECFGWSLWKLKR